MTRGPDGRRFTESDLAEIVLRRAQDAIARKGGVPAKNAGVKRWQALGRLPKDQMNNTEKAYAAHLQERMALGSVLWWKFHPMNVRLAKNTFYEVDFLVLTSSFELEIHETKGGYTSDKGQMKIKLCAEALPVFKILKVTKIKGGGWKYEKF